MRTVALALAALCALALAACSPEPVPSAPPAAATTTPTSAAPARPTTAAAVTVASLPSAPPLDRWVTKANDFQMTLDLNMQTKLIELGISPGEADEAAARSLAYLVCTVLRAGNSEADANTVVRSAYPTADQFDAIGIVLAAQRYCLDTVDV
jgi:hypothetical protein